MIGVGGRVAQTTLFNARLRPLTSTLPSLGRAHIHVAHISNQGAKPPRGRMSNQIERAIRVKRISQRVEERRKASMNASGEEVAEDLWVPLNNVRRGKGHVRSKFSELRQIRFNAVTTLQNLLYNKHIDREDACLQAERVVEDLTPFQRRESRIYNAFIRHLMRVKKVQKALRVLQDMKKNGVAPSMHTYLATFSGAKVSGLDLRVNTKVAKELIDLFADVENLWRSSFKSKTETPKKERRPSISGPREIPSTAESFEQTLSDAESETREHPQLFERTCERYLAYLFAVGQKEEGAKFLLRANELAAPENRTKVEAKTLSMILATEYLRCIGREGLRSAPELLIAEAMRHARSVLSSSSDDRKARQERRILNSVVQGGAPLALTHEDMHDILGSELPPDGPPSPKGKSSRKVKTLA